MIRAVLCKQTFFVKRRSFASNSGALIHIMAELGSM